MSKIWEASAPSNIALIKYMGKSDASKNEATNPSLSMTLSNFRTHVILELNPSLTTDTWAPLPNTASIKSSGAERFLKFFKKLKTENNILENFIIKSGNNFPSDAGLASSASSFAALTTCALKAFADVQGKPHPSSLQMALTSKTGSGSSCRSFFSPWCAWEGEKIYALPSKLPNLVDIVVILDSSHKKVSSSEAHKRVKSSPLFQGRTERAQKRFTDSTNALAIGDFKTLAEIAWDELWDMHSLFHTSTPPFFYFAPDTLKILRMMEDLWEKENWGPITTIDAGPNVHLLIEESKAAELRARLQKHFPTLLESLA